MNGFLAIFPHGDKPGGILFFTLSILALLLVLAIHELGHLLAGLAQGFRFELFVVGPLGVKRTGNGTKVYFNTNLGFLGGIAATIPLTDDERNRQKFAIMVAAGPLASLLLALIGFAAFALSDSGTARGFWLIIAAGSAGILLATTIPTKTGMFFTDRARFFRLISRGPAGQCEAALLSLLARSTAEGSCMTIDPEKARLLQTDTEPSMRFWGFYYEYHYFRDNAQAEEAEAAREKLLAEKGAVSPQIWKLLKIDEE